MEAIVEEAPPVVDEPDVNLASQLIVDVLTKKVDAAIVVSNDGDLRYAVQIARQKVMVGVINPSSRPTAEALKSDAAIGVGGHWWGKFDPAAIRTHQLPPEVGGMTRPDHW